jgi:hypothetical protein
MHHSINKYVYNMHRYINKMGIPVGEENEEGSRNGKLFLREY